ncbi:MAG: serine hydrolase domain-containing protein [Opitutus sp.]
MKSHYVLIGLCATFLFRSTAAAASTDAKPEAVGMSAERLRRVDDFVERLLADHKLAGAVTVVARRGQTVSLTAHGYADLAAKRPMRSDDLFHLQSMAKPILTVATLILLEEGRFLLSDPVEKYLPEFRNLKVAVPKSSDPAGYDLIPAERPITLLDLLTHRTGFPGLPADHGPAEALAREARQSLPAHEDYTLEEFVRKRATLPLSRQPGTAYRYSDTNADVMGRIIEVVSGRTLEEFFRERIFAPLTMNDTYFSVPPEKRARVASVYTRSPENKLVRLPADPLTTRFFSAGGNLYSTPTDYLQFCEMLLNGGELNGHRLLSRKSIELMTAYQTDSVAPFMRGQYIGLNVAVQKVDGASGLLGSPGTYGWAGSYCTYFRIDPQEKLILLFFTQQEFSAEGRNITYGFQNTVMQAITD